MKNRVKKDGVKTLFFSSQKKSLLRIPILTILYLILYDYTAFLKNCRGVAQFGRAPGLGPGGRKFESCHLDFFMQNFKARF